jgi:hypothetical protein
MCQWDCFVSRCRKKPCALILHADPCMPRLVHLQGDKERAQKMPTTPMCDRNTQERVALQKGFVDYVIGPYYKLVAAAYPSVAPVFDLIKHNREAWNRKSLSCVFLFVVGFATCVSLPHPQSLALLRVMPYPFDHCVLPCPSCSSPCMPHPFPPTC